MAALDLPVRRPMAVEAELVAEFLPVYGERASWPESARLAFAATLAELRERWLRGEVW